MEYVYPAILTPEEHGYSVAFPDLPGCYTCGDDLPDALHMAEDALSGSSGPGQKKCAEPFPPRLVPTQCRSPRASVSRWCAQIRRPFGAEIMTHGSSLTNP